MFSLHQITNSFVLLKEKMHLENLLKTEVTSSLQEQTSLIQMQIKRKKWSKLKKKKRMQVKIGIKYLPRICLLKKSN